MRIKIGKWYLIFHFLPLAEFEYKLDLNLYYTDEVNTSKTKISIIGKGYHPLKSKIPIYKNIYEKMPNSVVFKYFNNQMIQKCGLSLENLDFGIMNGSKNKTFILYNFSEINSFNFDFDEPGFLIKDYLQIQPNKGVIPPGKHKIIKCILYPNKRNNNDYDGDILVKITWNPKNNKILNNNLNVLPISMNIGKNELKRNRSFLDAIGNQSSKNNSLLNLGGLNISRIEK